MNLGAWFMVKSMVSQRGGGDEGALADRDLVGKEMDERRTFDQFTQRSSCENQDGPPSHR